MAIAENDSILQESARHHSEFFRAQWGIALISGAGFVLLALFVPGKPGEEVARVIAGILGALVVGGAFYLRSHVRKSIATVTDLLVRRPQDISSPKLIVMRRAGNAAAFIIELTDTTGKKYRLRVQSQPKAEGLISRALSRD